MSELWLRVGDREFEGRRENMELVLYLGELALYNHVELSGLVKHRIFWHEKPFETVSQYMVENNFPVAMNQVHINQWVSHDHERHLAWEASDIDNFYELLDIREDDEEL